MDQLHGLTEWAQVDLMDGEFVASVSCKPQELRQLRTDIVLEAHLMVRRPHEYLPFLKQAGFRRVLFHIEAVPQPGVLINEIEQLGMSAGIALNIDTSSEAVEPFTDMVSGVQFMAIELGWQGQEFMEEVVEKVRTFRSANPVTTIAVDGGISAANARILTGAGVDILVVGSAVFAGGSVCENLLSLQQLASQTL
ncbi:MAG: ribulose-phosphate 3-epimerase [Patescibacteria group bacterium]